MSQAKRPAPVSGAGKRIVAPQGRHVQPVAPKVPASKSSQKPVARIVASEAEVDYLLSAQGVRDRARQVYFRVLRGQGCWWYYPERMERMVDYVRGVILERHPGLEIPPHSRGAHFSAGGVDRMEVLESEVLNRGLSAEEVVRAKVDLVILSVLLDVGAGTQWKYKPKPWGKGAALAEASSSSKEFLRRSEALGVASFDMFMEGGFSSNPTRPFQADCMGLFNLTQVALQEGFQVSLYNPLPGVAARLRFMHALGEAVSANRCFVGVSRRPSNILDYLLRVFPGAVVPASELLKVLLHALGGVWPERLRADGRPLGDAWHYAPFAKAGGCDFGSVVPFHKLTQWLAYSLVEPLAECGIEVVCLDGLTPLPEYRNGGLLVDLGVIELKDKNHYNVEWEVGSEVMVEWRALTVVLLDKLAVELRSALGVGDAGLSLAQVLEGGTWWAGRRIAQEKRGNLSPPLKIATDWTVF